MQDTAFIKLDRLETENVLEDVNTHLDGSDFKAAQATVLAQDLPFYPGYRFLEVADHDTQPPQRRFVIHRPGHVVVMNGTNEPLYTLNEKAPITLNDDTVVPYVWFFFNNVRGRHGRFLMTENVDDIQWREEPPPAARKAIGKLLLPLCVTSFDAGAGYKLSCTMMFKDSLFKATVTVRPDGVVSLTDEELVIEDMPVIDDTFGQ